MNISLVEQGTFITDPAPGSVVHQRLLVAPQVAKKFADVSLNTEPR
jgi:hypothetical protein